MPRRSIRQARATLATQDDGRKQAVLAELEAIAASEITDVLTWQADGSVQLKPSASLSAGARKSIKKVKITPTREGSQIEVEMHDKISASRILAKHHGLLEPQQDNMRPSMIGINITGPKTTTYEVVDDDGDEEDGATSAGEK